MKKFLSRILVILIAMITLFEVAVPPTIRGKATYNIAYAKEDDKGALEKIGNALLFGLNLVISNIPGATTLEQIIRDITADTPIGDLVEELTLRDYVPERTCWYIPYATQSATTSAIDETLNTLYNRVTDKTNLRSNLYIYYLDKDGETKYPSKRRKLDLTLSGIVANQLSEQVYLVKGTVYKVPRYLLLKEVKESFLEDLEAMIANLLYSLANGLHFLISTALGKTITIDDLVFNKYAETNISYFESESEVGAEMASSLIYGNNNVGGLNSVVNKWYGIFQKIALMGYMAILVYMGIRIILGATAERKANYKELFMNWVVGIGILLLFPYAMKYIIKINEAMVKTIEANKGFTSTTSAPMVDISNIYDKTSIDDEIDWGNGNDYMSQLGFAAYQTEKVTLSFAFLIATWQLLVLIFHYYKRLFIIAYLIIIFPLVALSYAIDKIADGKSQALNTWLKEYMINVFVQTFHAIVYVFVCATVYASSGTFTTGNKLINGSTKLGTDPTTVVGTSTGLEYDFILIIVGITFLFKGEEIIRKIFGQESKAGTMKSLASSAAATYSKLKLAESAIQTAGRYTFGEKSMPRRFSRGIKNIGAFSKKLENFDDRATSMQAPNIGLRLEGAPTPPPSNASPNELQEYRKKTAAFNAVAILNNPKTHSLEEMAATEALLKKLAVEDPNNEAFKSSYISAGQFQALASLDLCYNRMTAEGRNSFEVEKEITARMAMIFPSDNEKQIAQKTNVYFTEKLHGATNNISKTGLGNEVQRTIDAINKEEARTKYGNGTSRNDRKVNEYVDNVANMYTENDSSLGDEQKIEIKNLARSLYILKQRGSGVYSQKEILNALNEIRTHADDNEVARQLVDDLYSEELDIDTLSHATAKSIARSRREGRARDIQRVSDYLKQKGLTESEIEDYNGFINNLLVLKDRNIEGYSKEKIQEALNDIDQNISDEKLNDVAEFVLGNDFNTEKNQIEAEYSQNSEESMELVELAESIVEDYEENPRDGFYDDELSSHEIIKDMGDDAALEQMIDSVFEARKNAVSEAGSQVALDILANRKVDILENHLDTETKTYDGYTKNEIYAQKIMAINDLLNDLSPFSKGGDGSSSLLDQYVIHLLNKSDIERESTYKKLNEKTNLFTSANEYIEERKKIRDKIENDHFMGDQQEKKKK